MPDARGNIQLGGGAEFDTIRGLVARWGDLAVSIGDDAAALDVPRGEQLVVSVDAFVIHRHFEPTWITPREIGYRAAAAALSDLAAMAALPIGVLVAINLPKDWHDRLGDIADGIGDAARDVGAKIVGGNLSAAVGLSITTTVLGHACGVLTRRGATAGQRVYVTGALGAPGAAVAAWKSGSAPIDEHRARFAHPVPRIREARWLADRGATACIDISDGLVADAGHIAAASGKQIEIALERLPLAHGVTAGEAARSGEEYELLIASPEIDTVAFADVFGIALSEVGVVRDGVPGVLVLENGSRVAPAPGHDHLSE